MFCSGHRKVFWKIDVPKMLGNIVRLQIGMKSFENTKRNKFLAKFQSLNLQLHQKVNCTISIFELACLALKNTCSKENLKEKYKNFEMQYILYHYYYLYLYIALHFQLLQLVHLTDLN